MAKFSIRTDSGSMTVEARTANAAVAQFMGAASGIKTVAQFKRYVEKQGGFGVIESDKDGIILRVR